MTPPTVRESVGESGLLQLPRSSYDDDNNDHNDDDDDGNVDDDYDDDTEERWLKPATGSTLRQLECLTQCNV